MDLGTWGKRAALRTARAVFPPEVLRRLLRVHGDCVWMAVPPGGLWPKRGARFVAAQFSGVGAHERPAVAAVVCGKHPTLAVLRSALEAATRPAPPSLQQLADRVAESRRGQQGVIERNAYLTGRRQRPVTVADDAVSLSLPPILCRFLYYIVRSLRPAVLVELGTAHGVSALHMLAAMEETGQGHLDTIDGDPDRRALALENLRAALGSNRFTSHQGYFQDVLPPLLDRVREPLDLAFDDGDHLPESTMANFRMLFPRLRSGGLLVIDDINHPTGNVTAWRAIISGPGVAGWIEVNTRLGICIKA